MSTTYGFVYILANEAMPGIIKIGYTDRSPQQRCVELSRGSCLPTPFTVLYYAEFENPRAVEREAHKFFAATRLNDRREFFRAPPERVMQFLRWVREAPWSEYIGDNRLLVLDRRGHIENSPPPPNWRRMIPAGALELVA